MGKIAFLFSGQGAQHSGMGKELYDSDSEVNKLFEQAEKLRPGTMQQCFDSDAETLKKTENTQPCLYLTDLAAAIALKNKGITPDALCGFSLGEIPALSFGKAFSYADGFLIASERGKAMAKANAQFDSSMLAVLKLENSVIEKACEKYDSVYPVNYNCHGQLVVAGLKNQLELFAADIKALGGRAIALAVSGGFHSPFMDGASLEFSKKLDDFDIKLPEIPVYSNFTASVYSGNPKELMRDQINHPVRWESIISTLIADGFDTFIECGAGNVLQKLTLKISKAVKCLNVENAATLQAAAEELI